MEKKIRVSDQQSVQEALDVAQKGCRTRMITAENVVGMCKDVERQLGWISKAALKGVTYTCDYHAQAFPNAYKGRPESTLIECCHNGREWVLTRCWRGDCRRPTVAYSVRLTDEAKAAVIKACESFGL